MQYFKGDDNEIKMTAVLGPLADDYSLAKDDFLEGAYQAAPLGDVIWDNQIAPLSNAIKKEIFRLAFPELVEAFIAGGSFESYLTVFRKIFGSDVQVTFTVPAAGKLNIDIVALGIEMNTALVRTIEDNQYIYDDMITQDGLDTVLFQTIKGFQSQYELEQMLYEMVPAGVYTLITLTISGS